MPTPIFAIRLAPKVRADLTALAKIYGAPNPGAFAREILTVVTSGDVQKAAEFNARLMDKIHGQLALSLPVVTDMPRKARKAIKRPIKGKGRGHARKRP